MYSVSLHHALKISVFCRTDLFCYSVYQKQQEQASDKKDQQKRIERDWKKKEQVRVKEGKTPFYLKKCKFLFFSWLKILNIYAVMN